MPRTRTICGAPPGLGGHAPSPEHLPRRPCARIPTATFELNPWPWALNISYAVIYVCQKRLRLELVPNMIRQFTEGLGFTLPPVQKSGQADTPPDVAAARRQMVDVTLGKQQSLCLTMVVSPGKVLEQLALHPCSVAWSPSGSHVATGGGNGLHCRGARGGS